MDVAKKFCDPEYAEYDTERRCGRRSFDITVPPTMTMTAFFDAVLQKAKVPLLDEEVQALRLVPFFCRTNATKRMLCKFYNRTASPASHLTRVCCSRYSFHTLVPWR